MESRKYVSFKIAVPDTSITQFILKEPETVISFWEYILLISNGAPSFTAFPDSENILFTLALLKLAFAGIA